MHTPPTVFTASAPAVPFVPMPLNTTATARCCCSSASERKKSSTGRACPRASSTGPRRSRPRSRVRVWPGRMTYTRVRLHLLSRPPPGVTGMRVCWRASNSTSRLSRSGGRCWMNTHAAPLVGRQRLHQLGVRLQAAGAGPHPHHRERQPRGCWPASVRCGQAAGPPHSPPPRRRGRRPGCRGRCRCDRWRRRAREVLRGRRGRKGMVHRRRRVCPSGNCTRRGSAHRPPAAGLAHRASSPSHRSNG